MSALRVAPGVYRDPYSGVPLAPGVWVPLPDGEPPAPVLRRPATPEELARLAPPAPVARRDDGRAEARRIRGAALTAAVREARAAARRQRENERRRARHAAERALRPPRPPRLVRPPVRTVKRDAMLARIADALRQTNGNRTRAAALLGISKGIVVYHVARYRDRLPADVPVLEGWKPPVPKARRTPEQIIEAVRLAGGHRSRAADLLGITRHTMYRRMARMELPEDIASIDGRRRGVAA